MDPIVSNCNKFRWRFENVKDLTEGGMFSDKFTFDDIDWKVQILKYGESLDICLYCETENENSNWICEVHGKLRLMNQIGSKNHKTCKLNDCYYQKQNSWEFELVELTDLYSPKQGFLKNGSIMIEVDLSFKYYNWSKSIPNFTDIIVNVEETEFHLNKWVLCSKSEYFYDLFVNKKVEDTRIELENVKVFEFCYMLASFFAGFSTDLEPLYPALLNLAKKLGVPSLTYKCEMFLISYPKMKRMEKIQFADEHGLENLMENCIGNLKNAKSVRGLEADDKFSDLKETTKLRIMNRLLSFL